MNRRLRSFVLWISVPLCVGLALTGLQPFWPGIYWRETRLGAAGALASDLIDLSLVLPVLAGATLLAVRGSIPALLVWAGTLVYLTYNFLIYAFEVHFNAMFPAYCAVLGLSFYGLIGSREFLSPERVARRFAVSAPRKATAVTLLVVTAFAGVNELKDILTAIHAGRLPASVADAGQRTDPIHVIDLCFFLPLVVTAAVQLLRRKDMGFTLAPALMVTMILISLEVDTMMAVFAWKGLPSSLEPVIFFSVAGALLTVLLAWFLRSARKVAPATGMPVQ